MALPDVTYLCRLFPRLPWLLDPLGDNVHHSDVLNNQKRPPGSNKRPTVGAESFWQLHLTNVLKNLTGVPLLKSLF